MTSRSLLLAETLEFPDTIVSSQSIIWSLRNLTMTSPFGLRREKPRFSGIFSRKSLDSVADGVAAVDGAGAAAAASC